ncbi:uncharacterized protein Z518_02889 [Rhinocladiella mackenziei CBS 650.93]|uniref:Cyclin n=1 Tax=Rhinocladiella mackenziei CBS 650.93 TaxID=1442369 RepID=A0A0D2HCN8_9EURO|nr:uncharacterized protein Z518_02889 [Rhinocladiella mackenziei CBS 650.93]KIX08233.1 hypothetical protein Z518_02889 [Rhinocladiella mackenziei CBS 650.93]
MLSISAIHRPVGSLDSHQDSTAHGLKRWNNINNCFAGGLPTPPGSKTMPGVVLGNGYAGFPAKGFQQDRNTFQDGRDTSQQNPASSTALNGNSYTLIPPSNGSSLYDNRRAPDQANVNAIAAHLQIPESVNKSKGSLAEFAAEITCLFWFETADTLQYAEDLPLDRPANRGLLPDAIPTIGFRKWVTTIISTTQVGKHVILLALMFIYRLKRFNPTVSGKRGSEFRLLTIALMLGNKFLDDNTYTNKTWAEVSGISVTEIHIMEVEFLSNMRYDLYASAAEWSEWKAKLGKFGAFYDKASQLPFPDESKGTTPVTPTSQSFPPKLPSPPSTHHSVSPFAASNALNGHYPTLPHPSSAASQLPNSPLRQLHGSAAHQQERKRSLDFSAEQPPAKRQQYSVPVAGQGGGLTLLPYTNNSLRTSPTTTNHISDSGISSTPLNVPRLDAPRIPTSSGHLSDQLAPLAVPVSRAMSSIYPNTTAGYSQPITPISSVQNLFQNPIPSLGDGIRPITNYPSAHTSPSNGFSGATPTLPGLSPSYFLTHRASPYRPVRHVNTLLIPPPSAALQIPVRNVPSDQIHYQPLSKATTERRAGPLPFMQADGWQHSNASTPVVHQQYQS